MMFSQEQIAIMESYFSTKPHCHVINAFQQKYSSETSPNASTITHLVQRFRDTGSVADKKRSDAASIVKTKVADALQRNPMKKTSVYINIITEFISLLHIDERYLDCNVQRDTRCNVSHIKGQYGSVNVIFR
ncbi:DUF4817 domain-containing protein [Trichonephila clavipes]|nr:DUF4817 domain-containing protein [Trichonephila clavipes]